MNNNCVTCDNLEGGNCMVKAPVYQITCLLCMQNYVGESGRSAHDRLIEHLRYAKHPTAIVIARTPLQCITKNKIRTLHLNYNSKY